MQKWPICALFGVKAGGHTEKSLYSVHGELVPHGFKFRAQHIIGARPTSNIARNGRNSPIRVTYNSPHTKAEVVRAAKAAEIWNSRQNDKEEGKTAYFKEVPPKGQTQTKRKPREPAGETETKSKKAKITHTNNEDPAGGFIFVAYLILCLIMYNDHSSTLNKLEFR